MGEMGPPGLPAMEGVRGPMGPQGPAGQPGQNGEAVCLPPGPIRSRQPRETASSLRFGVPAHDSARPAFRPAGPGFFSGRGCVSRVEAPARWLRVRRWWIIARAVTDMKGGAAGYCPLAILAAGRGTAARGRGRQ